MRTNFGRILNNKELKDFENELKEAKKQGKQETIKKAQDVIDKEIFTDLNGHPLPQCESLWRIKKEMEGL